VLLGLLLLTAAYLKYRDLTWEPFGKAVLIPPRMRVVFIEVEAIIGVWLLAGYAPRALWSVSTLYFAALAGVSAYLAMHGEPTCGCFGQATVNPWITFGIDVAAIGALAVTRPRLRASLGSDRTADNVAGRTVAVWAGVAFLAVVVVQVVRFGGPAAAWEALTAQSVAVEPALAEIGSGATGEETIFSVTLHNQSGHPVQIIGGTNNCVGNATLDLPITVPAGESRSVKVRGNFKGAPGHFIREYGFISDHDVGSVTMARFAGTVLPEQ
jgi:hypothetical protein